MNPAFAVRGLLQGCYVRLQQSFNTFEVAPVFQCKAHFYTSLFLSKRLKMLVGQSKLSLTWCAASQLFNYWRVTSRQSTRGKVNNLDAHPSDNHLIFLQCSSLTLFDRISVVFNDETALWWEVPLVVRVLQLLLGRQLALFVERRKQKLLHLLDAVRVELTAVGLHLVNPL